MMVRLLQVNTVVRDGWHNMTTDITYWRGCYWLVYRRVSAHYSIDSRLIVLRSTDLKRWDEVAQIGSDGLDWPPKFCLADNRLFLSFHTTYPLIEPRNEFGERISHGKQKAPAVSHVCYTDDGIHWSNPIRVLDNQNIYKMRRHDGIFYATAWGWQGDVHDHIHGPLDLLSGDDCLSWRKVSTIAGVEDLVDEADMWFHPNGEVWVICPTWRTPKDHAFFYSSKPPYKQWKRFDLGVTLHSPVFCGCDGKLYVAGVKDLGGYVPEPWLKPQTTPAGRTDI